MYSRLDNFWDRIRMKNLEMNREQEPSPSPRRFSSSNQEWNLGNVEDLDKDYGPSESTVSIPTINLDDDDEEDEDVVEATENTSIQDEEPLRGFELSPPGSTAGDRFRRSFTATPMSDDLRELAGYYSNQSSVISGRRSIHDRSPSLSGSISGRSSINRSRSSRRENYFATVPEESFGTLRPLAAVSSNEPELVSDESRIVMVANHIEKRIVRRSCDKNKPSAAPIRRNREKINNGPHILLGEIDLLTDTESEHTEERSVTSSPSRVTKPTQGPSNKPQATTTNSALLGRIGSTPEGIVIDVDAKLPCYEDVQMKLCEVEAVESSLMTEKASQIDHCTLDDSENSSPSNVKQSSQDYSFWDVSSSGCVKRTGSKETPKPDYNSEHTEFDLMLDKINKQVPAMSQRDRVEEWRVTKEDLLYSIPSVAQIESGTPLKRPMDDSVSVLSGESSSDSETSDSPSLLRAKRARAYLKKRRAAENALATGEGTSPPLPLSEDMDFRRDQVNPEIDKPPSMIKIRKNYYKIPTAVNRLPEREETIENHPKEPYEHFLRNDSDREMFASYLLRNPAYCPGILQSKRHLAENNGIKAVEVLVQSPETQTSVNENNSNQSLPQQQPAANRSKRYFKNRTKPVDRTLRHRKLRKMQLRKQSSKMNQRNYIRYLSKSLLRNGKVRKKQSLSNLQNNKKKKHRKPKAVSPQVIENPSSPAPLSVAMECAPPLKKHASSRESVDSAVSSSTSADHKKQIEKSPAAPDLWTLKNPLDRTEGEVLMIYCVADQLIVVQQHLISFWSYSKLTALLGLQQELQPVGQIKRAQTDSEVESANWNRLGFNESKPFYMEPRARILDEDKSRTCPLVSMYVNCYFPKNVDSDSNGVPCIRMKSLQLDTVQSEIIDVRFVPLGYSRYFVLCWHEQTSETDFRTGLCKYSLTPDLETLASIRSFPCVSHRISKLRYMNGNRLIGLGGTKLAIWNCDNGDLTFSVDLKTEISLPLATFIHTENGENALFLIHLSSSTGKTMFNKQIKTIAINMNKCSWHTVHCIEVALESEKISCESTANSETNGTGWQCVVFQSGELLAVSLDDLTCYFTNQKLLQAPNGRRVTRDIAATREKLFLDPVATRGHRLVLVGDKFIKLKTIEEYALLCR
ncbi:uncharacterized protein LOC129747503 [Uranotaenia lowii]|uniref:uncharacterized protein LOC129747503 n=1 Tax=Uranotaenia lowii TaxID=190385 RepID=UPI00247B1CAF|nr:uncharacterized protein LOC129747503 [Uranotaenia lowii]